MEEFKKVIDHAPTAKQETTAGGNAFRPGCRGLLLMQLWRVSELQDRYTPEKEPETELIAALSLDQALHYRRRRHGVFNIDEAESFGIIALLVGSRSINRRR